VIFKRQVPNLNQATHIHAIPVGNTSTWMLMDVKASKAKSGMPE